VTADLFGDAILPGLDYRPGLIDAREETAMIAQLEAIDLTPFRFHGWTGKRKTHTFGWRYDFDDSSFAPAEPLPDWLLPLRDRAAGFAGIDPDSIGHALVARYDPGAGIGWHRDRPVFDQVVGISLGAPAVLRFRQRSDDGFRRAELPIEPRSAYRLSGEARHDWEHRIVPGEVLRYSITFRTLSQLGRRKAAAD
jgi:alkylated DNA repair dioxygenase AlkB